MIPKPVNWEWLSVLQPFFLSEVWTNIESHITKERRSGKKIYPADWDIFDTFNYFSPKNTKVVIIGQDPYHGKGQAHGIAFSVRESNPKMFPPTLKNILRVAEADVNVKCKNGYLGPWLFQGVLLLNMALTVEEGKPGSHKDLGWDFLVDTVLNYLSMTSEPIVYMLWGEEAKKKKVLIQDNPHQLILETSHPSPLSVHKGFAFCKHFSKANEFLKANGKTPINWET